MPAIYVIHCDEDRGFVEKTLCPLLPSSGFERWVSSRHLGDRGTASLAIERVMAMCQAIVAIVSRAGLDSAALRDEIELGIASERRLIVVQADAITKRDRARMPAALWSLPVVDLTRPTPAARRELANVLPPVQPDPDADALAAVGQRLDWNEEIFSAVLDEAVRRHDHNRAAALIERFARHAADRPYPYPPAHANQDLARLRRDRQFKLMQRYAETAMASGTNDAQVRRQYAQALIEQGAFEAALEALVLVVQDDSSPREVVEGYGLIGRANKQQYLDAPRAPGSHALLRQAIVAYEHVYQRDRTELWHGVNAASCILRAHRDGVEGPGPARARRIAEAVLARIDELERTQRLEVWDCASRVEALLALGRHAEAWERLDAYLRHPELHAFEVSSTYRQFEQLVQLGEDPRGRPILDRVWDAVERHRAGSYSGRPAASLEQREGSGTAGAASRRLLIRVTDPDWQPAGVVDLLLTARLGTIASARGSDASVKQLLSDPGVISIDESRPAGSDDCERSLPFIRIAASYPGSGGPYTEKGAAALVAVIDNGIDVLHETFLDAQGGSRIVGVWDQADPTGPPPSGFKVGTYHDAPDIARYRQQQRVPPGLMQTDGHGTHVASIAVGRSTGEFFGGVAPEARLLVVIPDSRGPIGYSSSHIQALAFIDAIATRLGLPVVVNVSQGMNAGAHDGQSGLEVAFDEFSKGGRSPGRVVVKSAGNERHKAGHAKVTLAQQGAEELRFKRDPAAGPGERLELWWNAADEFDFRLGDPDGGWTPWVGQSSPEQSGELAGGAFLMQFIRRHIDNGDSQLRIEISDFVSAAAPGTWRVEIRSHDVKASGEIHAWIERAGGVSTGFENHADEEMTLSIPGTAHSVITVGAVDAAQPIRVGAFSSYGPTRDRREKPEVAAPGVAVRAARAGTPTGAVAMDGTSMAAPHVAGAIALVLSRAAATGQAIPTASQIRSALRQKTSNYNARWDRGQGFGVVDVAALLAAF